MGDGDGRRLELVAGPGPDRHEALLSGAGLLLGLFVGRSSLIGAATGAERIDAALGHFVLTVLVCVGSLLFLGRLYGSFQAQAADRERAAANTARAEADVRQGDDGSPPAMMPPTSSATS